MSSNSSSSKVVTVDEQAFEKAGGQTVDEDGFPVVDETPEFRQRSTWKCRRKSIPTILTRGSRKARITCSGRPSNRRNASRRGRPSWSNISAQAELSQQEGRAKRTRDIAAKRSAERRVEFQKRAASVNPMADPERGDPRAELTQEQLAAVNKQSMRLAKKLDGWSRAAIGRRLGEAVVGGKDLTSAVVGVFEELQTAPGTVIPIGKLENVNRKEVSIEGRVEVLWDADSPAIAQVGLIADDSGKTKVTSWVASDQPWIEEGERVRIHGAAKNWYNGRVSVALTGWSTVHFPERGRWWEA